MTKHRLGHVGNVPAGNVEPAVQHRAGLAAEDQILASSRTGTPTEVLANEFDSLLQKSIVKMGYSADEWLAAKAKYFSDYTFH